MVVSERDKLCAKALVEILNKAQLTLVGSEILVTGRVMEWSADLLSRIENDLKPQVLTSASQETTVKVEQSSEKLPKSQSELKVRIRKKDIQ